MNYVSVLGTISSDIKVRQLPSGSLICKFSIAHNERYKNQKNELIEKANFFDVTAFGKQAEVINQYFRKGSRILVQGSLSHDTWTAQDGTKRSKVSIKLDKFDFIDRKRNDEIPF